MLKVPFDAKSDTKACATYVLSTLLWSGFDYEKVVIFIDAEVKKISDWVSEKVAGISLSLDAKISAPSRHR